MDPGTGWVGTRYSPSQALPPPIPRVHPSHPHQCYMAPPRTRHGVVNMVVGLISVGQLSLCPEISRFQGITEGYNLLKIGRIINHLGIPGIK